VEDLDDHLLAVSEQDTTAAIGGSRSVVFGVILFFSVHPTVKKMTNASHGAHLLVELFMTSSSARKPEVNIPWGRLASDMP